MSRQRHPALTVLVELGLWGLINVASIGLAVLTTWVVCTNLLGWSPWRVAPLAYAAGVVSLTWGSWASLIWTRTRALRVVQQLMTMLPALATLAGAGALLYLSPGKWLVAAAFGGAGLGMLAASMVLHGGVFKKNAAPSRAQLAIGMAIFPALTTVVAGGVVALWFLLMGHLQDGSGWRAMISTAAVMGTTGAWALSSTVLPAATSRACQQVAALVRPR